MFDVYSLFQSDGLTARQKTGLKNWLTGFTATQVEAIDFWATEIILKKIFERTLQGLWEKVWDIVWQASTHAEK